MAWLPQAVVELATVVQAVAVDALSRPLWKPDITHNTNNL